MTSSNEEDRIASRLGLLRDVAWDRPEHRRKLEEALVNDGRRRAATWGWLTTKAALFLGIVLVGGMAAGATAAWIYDSIRIEPGESDGHGNCRFIITDEATGEQTTTEFLPEDSAFFSIPCDDDDDDATMIGVEPEAGGDTPKQR
jgi:hypothetical protein